MDATWGSAGVDDIVNAGLLLLYPPIYHVRRHFYPALRCATMIGQGDKTQRIRGIGLSPSRSSWAARRFPQPLEIPPALPACRRAAPHVRELSTGGCTEGDPNHGAASRWLEAHRDRVRIRAPSRPPADALVGIVDELVSTRESCQEGLHHPVGRVGASTRRARGGASRWADPESRQKRRFSGGARWAPSAPLHAGLPVVVGCRRGGAVDPGRTPGAAAEATIGNDGAVEASPSPGRDRSARPIRPRSPLPTETTRSMRRCSSLDLGWSAPRFRP